MSEEVRKERERQEDWMATVIFLKATEAYQNLIGATWTGRFTQVAQ